MNVSDAVLSRSSIRAFTKKPVKQSLIKELLEKSSRAANGGNLQPWKIYVINKKSMKNFLIFQKNFQGIEVPAYDIYPPSLKEPYRTSRFELGEQMYDLLGIAREDQKSRIEQVMKNFEFFGAPAAIFCFVDKQMGPPQWSDLGMFLQTFMLLATESGVDTCAQEAWSMKHESVSSFVNANPEELLFCGVAIGYRDNKAQINKLRSERRPLKEWATFL
jgi:nitroreductase